MELMGSRSGLLRFCDLLLQHAAIPGNQTQSEHDHYGPYMYLKVQTCSGPGISGNAIYGTVSDLRRLAGIVEAKLQRAAVGSSVRIQQEFGNDREYSLLLDVRD